MLSLQDIMTKTEKQRRAIHECLQKVTETSGYHPEDASLTKGLSAADTYEVKAALDSMSLAEVLQYGSSAQGADDIVAAKLHDTLMFAAKPYDICSKIGNMVTSWKGGALKVQIVVDGSYVPKPFASSGNIPEQNASFVTASLTPRSYGAPILAGDDLIEDQEYGIVQWHAEKAEEACSKLSSELAMAILLAAPDGDGTLNTLAASADETTYAQILGAVTLNGNDHFIADTLIITPESWRHSVGVSATGLPGVASKLPIPEGFDLSLQQLNVLFSTEPLLHAVAATDAEGAPMTNCISLIFDRKNSILTGRKRWMEIKNFSNPMDDIAGAVVSFRQDSVSLYKDSICVLTES